MSWPLERRCQACHRAGGIAPMAFESYKQTVLYAEVISPRDAGKIHAVT
jgi:hypothetical protein